MLIMKSLPNKNIYVLIESTNTVAGNNNTSTVSVTTSIKPTYYSKKSWNSNQPKPKMSNSFELLTGPIDAEIQKKYEILSDNCNN